MQDVIKELGFLCLGTRLKRLGDWLQADVQRLIDGAGLPIQAGQYPLLGALDLLGPLSVSELVEALGISQPGVTQMTARLEALGLVEIRSDTADRRTRTIALSAEGRRLIARSKRDIWPRIEAAVLEVCGGRKGPLLQLLTKIEAELEKAPLDERMPATQRRR
jgi:DNA-binding MarR family transcriptional regulator